MAIELHYRRFVWMVPVSVAFVMALVLGPHAVRWLYYRAQGIEIDSDLESTFHFEPSSEFDLLLERGRTTTGMESIRASPKGSIELRRQSGRWETATLSVTVDTLRQIADLIAASNIMRLQAGYRTDNQQGLQWRLRIDQFGHSKSVVCSNYIPRELTDFAARLDQIVKDAGLARVQWKPESAD